MDEQIYGRELVSSAWENAALPTHLSRLGGTPTWRLSSVRMLNPRRRRHPRARTDRSPPESWPRSC